MRKTIIIDEAKEQKIIANILESVFIPKATQVIEVEDYLNDTFVPKLTDTLDSNGYPTKESVFIMVTKQKQPLKTFDEDELLTFLDDRFHGRIKNDEDRRKFLKQVVDDWKNGKIKNGILSVNHL